MSILHALWDTLAGTLTIAVVLAWTCRRCNPEMWARAMRDREGWE